MKKPTTTSVLIGIAIFLIFLLVRFPFQNLKGLIFGKIYKTTGVYILADDISPSLFGWPGLGMRNVSLTIPMGSTELDLECQKLIFRVGLSGLFPPTPSYSLYMKRLKKGGDLYVKFSQNKNGLKAAIESSQFNLAQLTSADTSPIATGIANIDAAIQTNNANMSMTTGYATIEFQDLKFAAQNIQGIVLSEMKLGNVKGQLTAKNGIASVDNFQIGNNNSDLQGNMTGEIKLDPDWDSSFMNLSLKLKVSDHYIRNPDSATIASFLNTFKIGENEYSIRLSSSMSQFAQGSILLLQKGG